MINYYQKYENTNKIYNKENKIQDESIPLRPSKIKRETEKNNYQKYCIIITFIFFLLLFSLLIYILFMPYESNIKHENKNNDEIKHVELIPNITYIENIHNKHSNLPNISFIINIQNHVNANPIVTINSIKDLNITNYEIILVIDFLYDNLKSQLNFFKYWKKLIIIEQNKLQDIHEALKVGYERANGEYIMFLEHQSTLDNKLFKEIEKELIYKSFDILNLKRVGYNSTEYIKKDKKIFYQPEIYNLYIKENYDNYHYGKLINRKYLTEFFGKNIKTNNFYANNEIMKDYVYLCVKHVLYLNKEYYKVKKYDNGLYDYHYMLNNFKYMEYLLENKFTNFSQEQINIVFNKRFNVKNKLYNKSRIIDNSEYYINILNKIKNLNIISIYNKLSIGIFEKKVMYFYYHMKDNIKNISEYINECKTKKIIKRKNDNNKKDITFIIILETDIELYVPLLYSIFNLNFQNYSILFTYYKKDELKYNNKINKLKEKDTYLFSYIEYRNITYNELLINAINKIKTKYVIIFDSYDFIMLRDSLKNIKFIKYFNYIIPNAFCYQKFYEYIIDNDSTIPNTKYIRIFEKLYIINYLKKTKDKFINTNNDIIEYKNHTYIEYSTNKHFTFPTLISIQTALQSKNINSFYHFYILHTPDFSETEKRILLSLHNKYIGFKINFIDMKDEYINYSNLWLYPQSSFYRINFANMMPNLNRSIHLDCDSVVLDDLSPLMYINMKNKTVLGFSESGNINSGVMVTDLKRFRRKRYLEIFKNSLKNSPVLVLPDQEILNTVMWNEKGKIDARYGISYCFYQENGYLKNYDDFNSYNEKEIKEAYENPAIVHYFSSCLSKPWWGSKYKKVWIKGYEWYNEVNKTDFSEEIYQWAIK